MLDDIRERHVEARGQHLDAPKGTCRWCRMTWPCDAVQVLDVLDGQLQLNAEAFQEAWERVAKRHKDDAARLGKALREVFESTPGSSQQRAISDARDALRQHDEGKA